MNKIVIIGAFLIMLTGSTTFGGPPSVDSTANQSAEIRRQVEKHLDTPNFGVMPFSCHRVQNDNPVAQRHFVRGCNLIGLYDPHDNMTSSGLSNDEMLRGIDRAVQEFELALKADPKFSKAKTEMDRCKETKKSEYFKVK